MRADDEQRYVDYVTSRLTWLRKIAFLLCQDWHHADEIGHQDQGATELRERGTFAGLAGDHRRSDIRTRASNSADT